MGGVSTDNSSTESDGRRKDGEVDVLRNLLVAPHETRVDILGVAKAGLAADRILETDNDLAAVVQVGVGGDRGVDGEIHPVVQQVPGREVQGRVSLVGGLVEETVLVHRIQDLVTSPGVVEHAVGGDGDVCRVPGVCVPDEYNDGEDEQGPEK